MLAERSHYLASAGVRLSQRAQLAAEDVYCGCLRVGAARSVLDGVKSRGESASEGEGGTGEGVVDTGGTLHGPPGLGGVLRNA